MTALRPFFLLVGRAAVFWLGLIAVASGGITVTAIAAAERADALHLDATFLATLYFPGVAGWLLGLVVQEFQQTSVAWPLPGARSRLAAGYVATGIVAALVVAAWIGASVATSPNPALTFALGLGAYLAAGVLRDPRSRGMTFANTILVLVVFGASRDLARTVGAHPWAAGAVALGVGAGATARLFARSTFRRGPFRLAKPLPGRFSIERTQEYERRRALERRASPARWRGGYLDRRPWAWVRAAFHETHGAIGWRDVLRAIGPMWGLGILVMLDAWFDRGSVPFGEAIARTLYDALFRSPHHAPLAADGGAYPIVLIVIAAVGVAIALFKAVGLGETLLYPLSRSDRARVAFRAGLVDVALLALVLGVGLYAVGVVTSLFLGYALRFDFVPFHVRALLVTLVLLPLGHQGRLRLRAAARRRAANTIVGVVLGITAFVVVVVVCVLVLSRLGIAPGVEIAALVAALVVSQVAYRRMLGTHYRTADLA